MFTNSLSLPNRVNQQALPHIDIVDMREELSEGIVLCSPMRLKKLYNNA